MSRRPKWTKLALAGLRQVLEEMKEEGVADREASRLPSSCSGCARLSETCKRVDELSVEVSGLRATVFALEGHALWALDAFDRIADALKDD